MQIAAPARRPYEVAVDERNLRLHTPIDDPPAQILERRERPGVLGELGGHLRRTPPAGLLCRLCERVGGIRARAVRRQAKMTCPLFCGRREARQAGVCLAPLRRRGRRVHDSREQGMTKSHPCLVDHDDPGGLHVLESLARQGRHQHVDPDASSRSHEEQRFTRAVRQGRDSTIDNASQTVGHVQHGGGRVL